MTKDLVYVFDKLNNRSSLLGEIQSDFNMSLVIDGTKDSTTIIVWSYSGVEIEPWSIVLHEKTMTWWCVSHDKVERYQNDDGSFVWLHNLELNGAIELLNARDLTDCGFNDRTYTVGDFIHRLFKLSNIEYTLTINAETNFLNKQVDFIKTFENYTLSSALREFLDAYNMCPKITFSYVTSTILAKYALTGINLKIIPKTGNRSRVHQMEDFDDVRETKTMDKNSFGTSVVSNAENVISTQAKTYPSFGCIKLSSNEWSITRDNAILRLPTKAFKINWISVSGGANNTKCVFKLFDTVGNVTVFSNDVNNILNKYLRPTIKSTILVALQKVKEFVISKANTGGFNRQGLIDAMNNQFESLKNQMAEIIMKSNTTKIYSGNTVNAETGAVIQGDDVPYLARLDTSDGNIDYRYIGVFDKETRNMLKYQQQGIYWERGSDLIEGFRGIIVNPVNMPYIIVADGFSTEYQSNDTSLFSIEQDGSYEFTFELLPLERKEIRFEFSQWQVNYVPMSDLKVKVDNQRDKRDIQLYNQNGKLTDSVALSKLLNSYSKEISSDTTTKYMHYYSYNDVPQVGDIVMDNNVEYVINNVSIDFTQNETSVTDDFGYFLDCEITMSKYVSTKSLMVNPNTNIRDYGIPQNYNVKRKQLYRDYYELSYYDDTNANTETPYLSPSNIFNFGHSYAGETSFVTQIKLSYEEPINNSYDWCYQLETTTYFLDKMLYVLCDFNDNNIIGYSFMNAYSGINLTNLFNPIISINTPISYVDNKGKFNDIKILFLTPQELEQNILDYKELIGYQDDNTPIYNASCFIDERLFEISEDNNEIEIEETEYNKDALEVPVFEYVCQIGDSEYVLIGDNILKQYSSDFVYFYSYVYGDNINQNNAFTTTRVSYDSISGTYVLSLACEFSFNSTNKELSVSIWNNCAYDPTYNYWQFGTRNSYINKKDYAIFRHAYNVNTGEEIIDLMFIAKKVPHSGTSNLVLKANHYKLK